MSPYSLKSQQRATIIALKSCYVLWHARRRSRVGGPRSTSLPGHFDVRAFDAQVLRSLESFLGGLSICEMNEGVVLHLLDPLDAVVRSAEGRENPAKRFLGRRRHQVADEQHTDLQRGVPMVTGLM